MSPAPAQSDLEWVARYAWLALGALAFVQFTAVATPILYFHGGDNAHYLELARALAAGEGYRDLLIDPPGPHTKYPPGFPLLLAAVLRLAGEDLQLMKGFLALFGGVMVGATALLWRIRGDALTALAAALWVATVPMTLTMAMRLLSELPFTAFVVLALLGCERAVASRRPLGGWAALAALGALAAVTTRMAGLALVPALAGAALLAGPERGVVRDRIPRAWAWAGPAALAGLAWLAYVRRTAAGASREYMGEFFLTQRTLADGQTIGLADVLARIVGAGGYYVDALGRSLAPVSAGSGAAPALGAVVLALGAVGFVNSVRTRWGSPEIFTLSYLALIAIWPAREERFLIPLFPMLLYYALLGVRTAARSTRFDRAPEVAVVSLTAAVFVANVVANLATLAEVERHRFARALEIGPGLRIVALHEGAARLLGLAAHLRSHAEADARVLVRKPRLFAVATERMMVGPPYPSTPEALVPHLEAKGVDYVVVDELYAESARIVVPAIVAAPDRFTLFYRLGDTGSRIHRFRSSPGAPSSQAPDVFPAGSSAGGDGALREPQP